MKTLLMLGIVLALALTALAYPTLSGPTGLLTVPTAAVAPGGQFQLAADLQYVDGTDELVPLRALYGIGEKFEVGFTYLPEVNDANDTWGVNGKYVLPYTLGGAAWAIGAAYSDSDNVSTIGASLSATKEFAQGFKGTAALLYADRDVDEVAGSNPDIAAQVGDEDNHWAVALGAQATLDNGLTVIGEYVNALPGGSLNAAIRYPVTAATTVQLGFIGDTSETTLGFTHTFGGSAK